MAAVAARKTAAKKTTAPRAPRAPRPVRPVEEVTRPALEGLVLEANQPAQPPDTFPIFAIGDVQYYAPASPPVNVELTYLWKIRHEGTRLATAYLLEELLGDGYVALMNYPALTAESLAQIVALLREAMDKASPAGPKEQLRIG